MSRREVGIRGMRTVGYGYGYGHCWKLEGFGIWSCKEMVLNC